MSKTLWRIIIIAVICIVLAVFWRDQNNRIVTAEYSIYFKNLPASFDGFRIINISDLHGRSFGKENEILLGKIREAKPDIIAMTGDMADDPSQIAGLYNFAEELTKIAPVYYVYGNHEWSIKKVKEITELMEDAGVCVLRNEYKEIILANDRIVLAGLEDPNGPADQLKPLDFADKIHAAYPDKFVLTLAHRNDHFDEYAQCGYDLVLSGHAHGGIVRLPGTDGLIGTNRRLFPKYTNGLYKKDDTYMVVSRGLGFGVIKFRLFNHPHLPVAILKTEN